MFTRKKPVSSNEEVDTNIEITATEYARIVDVRLEPIKPSASSTSSIFLDIDPSTNLSICLLNCQQIYVKLESFLKMKNASLKLKSLVKQNASATVFRVEEDLKQLKHSSIWKAYVEEWLKEFTDSEIKFKRIKLNLIATKNLDLYTFLEAKIAKINHSFFGKSVFFEFSADTQHLNGYGLLIPLYRNIEDLKFQILNRRSSDTSKLTERLQTSSLVSIQDSPEQNIVSETEIKSKEQKPLTQVVHTLNSIPSTPLSLCLFNCKKIFYEFKKFMYNKDPNLNIKFNASSTKIRFSIDNNRKKLTEADVEKWSKKFARNEIVFEFIEIRNDRSRINYDFLSSKISDLNKYNTDHFFEFSRDNRFLVGYGFPKNLAQNIANLKAEMMNRTPGCVEIIGPPGYEAKIVNPPWVKNEPLIKENPTEVNIKHFSLLYLSLFSFKHVRNVFASQLALHNARLELSNMRIFVTCESNSVYKVNREIKSFKKQLILENVNIIEDLNYLQDDDLKEFKKLVGLLYEWRYCIQYRFFRINDREIWHILGLKMDVERFFEDVRLKYQNIGFVSDEEIRLEPKLNVVECTVLGRFYGN
jgi:hypothetical protein